MPGAVKRWTFRILIMLILGVVTTVGVAWGLAAADRELALIQCLQELNSETHVQAGLNVHRALGVARYDLWYNNRTFTVDNPWAEYGPIVVRLPKWTPVDHTSNMRSTPHGSFVAGHYNAFGLPSESLYYGVRMSEDLLSGDVEGAFRVAAGDREYRLPLRPIFPGFIVNTLFYSGVWFGIFFGVGFFKRVLRRKRGRCVKCSYDLRREFDKGCPECGWGREQR